MTSRDAYLRRTYGITEADYEEMLARQAGVCGICARPPKRRRLHVDHNHKTGKVRGLLCFRCNSALRYYVTIDWCKRVISYLKEAGE